MTLHTTTPGHMSGHRSRRGQITVQNLVENPVENHPWDICPGELGTTCSSDLSTSPLPYGGRGHCTGPLNDRHTDDLSPTSRGEVRTPGPGGHQ